MKWKNKLSWAGTGVFTILGIIYILPILIVLIPVTILTFAVSGWTTQWIAGRKKHD